MPARVPELKVFRLTSSAPLLLTLARWASVPPSSTLPWVRQSLRSQASCALVGNRLNLAHQLFDLAVAPVSSAVSARAVGAHLVRQLRFAPDQAVLTGTPSWAQPALGQYVSLVAANVVPRLWAARALGGRPHAEAGAWVSHQAASTEPLMPRSRALPLPQGTKAPKIPRAPRPLTWVGAPVVLKLAARGATPGAASHLHRTGASAGQAMPAVAADLGYNFAAQDEPLNWRLAHAARGGQAMTPTQRALAEKLGATLARTSRAPAGALAHSHDSAQPH